MHSLGAWVLGLGILVPAAGAQLITVDNLDAAIYALDEGDGLASEIGAVDPDVLVLGLTFHQSRGEFYAVGTDLNDNHLLKIDPETWTPTVVEVYPGFDWVWLAMEYVPAADVLYAVRFTSGDMHTELFLVDPDSGAATHVGDLPFFKTGDMAYNPVDGRMYVTVGQTPAFLTELHSFDLESGKTTFIGEFDRAEIDTIGGLVFHPTLGLLGLQGLQNVDDNSLYSINIETADVELIGCTGANGVKTLAFRPRCDADFNQDGDLNILDFVAFQSAWKAADQAADCDQSGGFDVLDFVCFQGRFLDGCS